MRKIEVCCGSIQDVVAAKAGGATRVELCGALSVGGITPSAGLIAQACKVGIDVNVLIRPREGDFCYTPEEIEVMKRDIRFCRECGAHGVVIGALNREGHVDKEAMAELMSEAGDSLSVTFHRAFDVCTDPMIALEDVIEIGCDRILTSGMKPTAIEGKETLRKLVDATAGRIIIMPGSGINQTNIGEIETATGASEFHSSATDKLEKVEIHPQFGANPRHSSTDIIKQLVSD